MTALISLSSPLNNRSPVLSILDGLHQGVTLSLDKPFYSLGAGLHCDLVFSDSNIADEHLHLRIYDRDVTIEARGGDVRVMRGAHSISVPMGSGHRARLPLQLGIGAARLSVVPAEPRAYATIKPQLNTNHWPWMIAVVALLLGGSAFAFKSKPGRSQLPATVATQPSKSTMRPELTLEQARDWLEKQLRAEGLRAITLRVEDDQLIATGVFERPLKNHWVDLQQRFDQQFGNQVMLRSNVTQRPEIIAPRVRFQAVWFGPDPYVISDSGKRLYAGAALPDDWVLERVDPDAVILSRGDERFNLTF
jgi:hypothetical protein